DGLRFPASVLIRHALLDSSKNLPLQFRKRRRVVGADVDFHASRSGNGVDRSAAGYDADRERGAGVRRGLQVRYAGNGPAHRVNRARRAEIDEAVAAWTLEPYQPT